jgi:hypothetical protein
VPLFSLQVQPLGPLLSAVVGVSEAREEALRQMGQPVPPLVPIRALIDTGASCTCLDPSVLATLKLSPTGSVSVNTPSTGLTPHTADQYDIGLAIPNGIPLILRTIPVVASELLPQGFHALLGRDILEQCLFVYNGKDGFFTLAF